MELISDENHVDICSDIKLKKQPVLHSLVWTSEHGIVFSYINTIDKVARNDSYDQIWLVNL